MLQGGCDERDEQDPGGLRSARARFRSYAEAVAKKTSKKAVRKKAPSRRRKAASELAAKPAPGLAGATPTIGLDEVLGQEHAVGVLDSAVSSDRLHHAWLFHGPEGVGKFTTALAFAAAILDPTSVADLSGRTRPDPDSQVQRLLRGGSHPDLQVVRKELAAFSREDRVRRSMQTSISIEVVREFLIEPATRTRVVQGDSLASKVFIVDEAHLLGREAQDTMLKTLEEPGPGVVLILVTASEDQLRPTIRSRCQRVGFRPLDAGAMAAWIGRSEFDMAGVDQEWAVSFADGSPGVLTELVKGDLGAWHAELRGTMDRLADGVSVLDAGRTLSKLVDAAAAASVEGKAHASKAVANRAAASRMFRLLGEGFRTAMRSAATVGRVEDAERLTACIAACEEAERQLDSNVALGPVFENLAARCGVER